MLGSGGNAAGRTIGLSLPNRHGAGGADGARASAAPASRPTASYFEAHGTGTRVGDPAETWAIGSHGIARRRAAPLPIGSVKTNIGHPSRPPAWPGCSRPC